MSTFCHDSVTCLAEPAEAAIAVVPKRGVGTPLGVARYAYGVTGDNLYKP